MTCSPTRYLAVDVLTDSFLLQRIVSFQRGLPRDIVELARSLNGRGSSRANEDDADDAEHNIHDDLASLTKYAIKGPNLRFLQRLFRYYMEQPAFCRTQRAMSFHGAWQYAVEQDQLAIAQWIQDQPALPCIALPSEIWKAVIASRSTSMLAYVIAQRPELMQSFHAQQVSLIATAGSVDMLVWIKENTSREMIPYSLEAVRLAAGRGHLAMVRHLHEHFEVEWSAVVMDAAAKNGHLEIVKLLHEEREESCTAAAMDNAAGNGHLDIVRFLHEKRTEGCTTGAMDKAAANGHLDIVQFLHENRTEGCTKEAIDKAAGAGHVDILQYLHKHRREGCTIAAVVDAAERGHLDVVQFLHEKNSVAEWTPSVMDAAAARGHFDVVRFLHENRSEGCTYEAFDKAVDGGYREIAFFLHQHRTEGCTARAMDHAARNGDLDMVRFLHENRSEGCTDDAVDLAAERGHLEIVKFLLVNRAEGDTTKAMDRAAAHGRLEVVQYLLENHGAGGTSTGLEAAIRHDWMDVAHALLAKDPFVCSPQALRLVAEKGDLAFTQQLFGLAPSVLPWTATDAALKGHTEIVKFILERAPNCRHEHVIVGAATGGSVEAVRFLHENYHQHCTPSALYEAARHGHVDVLKYLLANCSVTPTKLILRAVYSGGLEVVQFVLDHWPNPSLAEAHAIAVRREYPEIVTFLADIIAREKNNCPL